MKQSLNMIRSSLAALYPAGEIEGFIRLIFEELCGYTLTDLLLRREEVLPDALKEQIATIVQRLKRCEPIQYVLGVAHWDGMRMQVGEGVLIPRPETAEIVSHIRAENLLPGGRVVDVCTGSGCIAIALAKAWPEAQVEGWDISPIALQYAARNARANGADVTWRECDVLAYKPGNEPRYDIIVSNPPYILDSERESMDANVLEYEPHLALFVPDDDPLRFYRAVARMAQCELRPGGKLYFEINATQGESCCMMLVAMGFADVCVVKDFMGNDRMVKAVKR